MKSFNLFQIKYKYLGLLFLLLFLIPLSFPTRAFSANRSTPFTVGETLDPGADAEACGPTDENCFPSVYIINPIGTASGDTGQMRFRELAVNGTNHVGFRAPDTLSSSVLWTLPSADGSSGQVLSTNGSGVLSWTTASGSSLSTSTIRTMFTSSATGLTYTSGTGDFSLTSGYNIPLTASTTAWEAKTSSQWTTSGSNIYYSTGNVGIGTTSPVALLGVGGNAYIGGSLTATGALTALTINGNTITSGSGVLTIGAGKTLTSSNTLTLAGTDGTTMTFPSTSATIARTDTSQTFTGTHTFSNVSITTQLDTNNWRFSSNALNALSNNNIGLGSGSQLAWNSSDLTLNRDAAATLQLGTDSATPIAQTIKGTDSRAGTDNNVAGGSLTIAAGRGTGTGGGGSLIFQTAPVGSSGTTANTLTTAMTILNTANVGIGTTTPGQKLSVSGSIQSTDLLGGATTLSTDANGIIIRTPSDGALKENVAPLSGALDKVLQLEGVSYNFINKNFGSGKQIGFIAQDVEVIVPEVVTSGGEYKSLNYGNLVALVVEAVKELAVKLDKVLAWFNGNRFEIQGEVCVDSVCLTKEEFKALLLEAKEEEEEPDPAPGDSSSSYLNE